MDVTTGMDEGLRSYMLAHGMEETPELRAIRELTHAKTKVPAMQISPEQGSLMQVMARALGVKRYLEVGVFTGYSALSVALALPDDGQVVACDVSEEWTSMAKPHWESAGVAHKIDLRLAPAADTLAGLVEEGQAGTFDMMFIDADKENYDRYYELGLKLVRPGGMIMIDNVLWGGSVIDSADQRDSTTAIRAINSKVKSDDRVWSTIIPVGDGITLAVRK